MFQSILPFISEYLNALNFELKREHKNQELSTAQIFWFSVCLMLNCQLF
jgi:hypothetical protein